MASGRASDLFSAWFRTPLWKRVMAGLVLGIAWGLASPGSVWVLEPFGELFLRSIRMIVPPLVLATLANGVVSVGDLGKMGLLGSRTIAFYLATTVVAMIVGLAAGGLLAPGAGIELPATEMVNQEGPPSLVDRLVEMVPTNPFAALASGNMLQIIFFAVLLGIGILLAGRRGRPLSWACASLAEVMLRITHLVMEIAPLGVMALIAAAAARSGVSGIGALLKLVTVYYAACLVHMTLVYPTVLRGLLRLPVKPFLQGVSDAQMVAASTTSSSATLPVTMVCVEDNLGVDPRTASFVLPLGSTINMDGTGVYLGVVALFAAQASGVTLGWSDYGTLLVTGALASVGAAGVPGGSLLMVTAVLQSLGLPLETFALIAGVDRLIDIARTVVNVTSDALAAVYIAHREGGFDQDLYLSEAQE